MTATVPGVPAGTVTRGRQLLAAARQALGAAASATDEEIADHLTLGQRCGAAAPSAPVDVGGGWVCADLGGEGDAEAFERLLAVLGPGPHHPEEVARRAQEWRLPVTPYRASPRFARCPRLPTVDRTRPLAGTRVVDLTSMWAGPLATHLLVSAGADVDTVEAACRPDGLRGTPAMFEVLAAGKRRHDLDLRQEEVRREFLDLVADADVVVESFSPRVLPNLGLDLPMLLAVNPDVVLVSMPAFAPHSPERDWVAYGTGVHAASGLGIDDDGRAWAPAITYPDPLGGLAGFTAVCTALALGLQGQHLVVPLEAALAGLQR